MKLTSKHKKPLQFKVTLTAVIVVLVAVAAIVMYVLFIKKDSTHTSTTNASTFRFDTQALPEWTSGGTNHPTAKDFAPGSDVTDLPASDTIIHLKDTTDPSNCFVTYAYIITSKDATSVLQEQLDKVANSGPDFSYIQTDVKKLSMNTSEGVKPFDLHQYNIEGSQNVSMLRATEFGFFDIGKGYIEIRGNCTTVDQLTKTLPVLSAVNFNE